MQDTVRLTNGFITLMQYNNDFFRTLELINNRYMKYFCIIAEDSGHEELIFNKTFNTTVPNFRERRILKKIFDKNRKCTDEMMYTLMSYMERVYPSEINSDRFYTIPFIIPMLGAQIRHDYRNLCEEMKDIEDKGSSVLRLLDYIKERNLSISMLGKDNDDTILYEFKFNKDNEYEKYRKMTQIGKNISRGRIIKNKKAYMLKNLFISFPHDEDDKITMCGFNSKNGVITPIPASETRKIIKNDAVEYCNLSI